MSLFVTTQEIFSNPWNEEFKDSTVPSVLPPRRELLHDNILQIEDVQLWEKIYYEPGLLGIYASWDPFGELYMITYNLFIETDFGIETFYGPTAATDVAEKAKTLGIFLEINKIWINKTDTRMYDDTRLIPF